MQNTNLTKKFYLDEATDFYNKEISKVDSNLTCLAVISLDSALNKDGSYYLQVFLKECKYISKVMIMYITEDIVTFDDSNEPDEEQFLFFIKA